MTPCPKCGKQPRHYTSPSPGPRGNGYTCCDHYTGTHRWSESRPLSIAEARNRWNTWAKNHATG